MQVDSPPGSEDESDGGDDGPDLEGIITSGEDPYGPGADFSPNHPEPDPFPEPWTTDEKLTLIAERYYRNAFPTDKESIAKAKAKGLEKEIFRKGGKWTGNVATKWMISAREEGRFWLLQVYPFVLIDPFALSRGNPWRAPATH